MAQLNVSFITHIAHDPFFGTKDAAILLKKLFIKITYDRFKWLKERTTITKRTIIINFFSSRKAGKNNNLYLPK